MGHQYISLENLINEEKNKLQKVYNDKFEKEFMILELFYNQISQFVWILDSGLYENAGIDILGSSIIKALTSLISSLTLEKEGQFGSSRILLRHVYEYLIIGKYYSITKDEAVLKKWRKEFENNRNDISIRKLLKSVDNINPKLLLDFWSDLCDFNHATKYSQQIGFSYETYKRDFELDQSFIIILLDMMYHFMHSHFVTSDFKNAYILIGKLEEWEKYIVMRDKQKFLLGELKEVLGKDARSMCYLYKRRWFKCAIT